MRPKQVRLYLYVRAGTAHPGRQRAPGQFCMHGTAITGVIGRATKSAVTRDPLGSVR